MASEWAHASVSVEDSGSFSVDMFNAVDDNLAAAGSWQVLFQHLSKQGWELVQFHRFIDSTVYWFKKQLS